MGSLGWDQTLSLNLPLAGANKVAVGERPLPLPPQGFPDAGSLSLPNDGRRWDTMRYQEGDTKHGL